MKLIGLSLVRNEDWIIEFSLRASLSWCDGVLVMFDRCTDQTEAIVKRVAKEHPGRVQTMTAPQSDVWDEMDLRQSMLHQARTAMGATHLAIIDADEMLTANLAQRIRGFFDQLAPGWLLDLPMLAARSLTQYHDDNSVWSRAQLTLGFCDMPGLAWKAAGDSYQHHNRAPYGNLGRLAPLQKDKSKGGVIHFQFANARRLLAKHVLYRMVDHIRWPGRESVQKLNWKYSQALDVSQAAYQYIPSDWWLSSPNLIELDGVPYQEDEIRALLHRHGRQAFAGLDLLGF